MNMQEISAVKINYKVKKLKKLLSFIVSEIKFINFYFIKAYYYAGLVRHNLSYLV